MYTFRVMSHFGLHLLEPVTNSVHLVFPGVALSCLEQLPIPQLPERPQFPQAIRAITLVAELLICADDHDVLGFRRAAMGAHEGVTIPA